jgi:hypothetical protein
MIGFIGTSLELQSIITAHNQWLSTTCSILYRTTSTFSSTVMNDKRWITAHTLNSELSYEWISWIHEWTLFHNFGQTNKHYLEQLVVILSVVTGICFATCYRAKTRLLPLVAAGKSFPSRCSAMDVRSAFTIPAFRRCLPIRCLAMDYSVTIYRQRYTMLPLIHSLHESL